MQYAAPGLCLTIGLGFSVVLDRARAWSGRDRLLIAGGLGLVLVGIVPQVEGFVHPYRAYQAEAARQFARKFWPEVGRGAEVSCLRWDEGVAEWDSIHLGVAVMLCNQAMDSPSRRSGGPDWGAVSATHPIRCVLGVASEADAARISAWLERMRDDYLLNRRERIDVETNEPGRPARPEHFDVFEFIPRR